MGALSFVALGMGLAPPLSAQHRYGRLDRLAQAWLECRDCLHGELDSLLAAGEPMIPVLARYLEIGPDSERRARFVGAETGAERLLRSYANSHPEIDSVDSRSYVRSDLARFVNQYQGRAATALSELPSPQARVALDSAYTVQRGKLREHVGEALRQWDKQFTNPRRPPRDSSPP